MDQGLKQRLVGASVLIVIGIVAIPWLLDGAGARHEDSAQIELPVPELAKRATSATPTVEPKKTTVAKAKTSSPPKASSTPKEQPAKIRPNPASDPRTGWVAQVGSFESEENAKRLTERLKGKGYPAFVMRHTSSKGPMYRVRVGPERSRGTAEDLAKRLKKDGHDSKVVSHP